MLGFFCYPALMLKISNLTIAIADQEIISNLTIEFQPGSVHAIMGPNGSGKSTLAHALMGHPKYVIKQGLITFNDVDITSLPPHKRAQLGIFLAFQQPFELQGVKILTFLKEIYQARTNQIIDFPIFQKLCADIFKQVGLDANFMERNVNEGFSGGEKKRFELVQLLLFNPSVVILDEIDSGLDIDALMMVGQVLEKVRTANPRLIVLIITHYPKILHYVVPVKVHIMHAGSIIQSGAAVLAEQLEQKGYQEFV